MYIDLYSWHAWNAIVYLDGFQILCVSADDKAGWVEVYDKAHPHWGLATIDPTKKLYGSVRIEIIESDKIRSKYKAERQYRGLFKPRSRAKTNRRAGNQTGPKYRMLAHKLDLRTTSLMAKINTRNFMAEYEGTFVPDPEALQKVHGTTDADLGHKLTSRTGFGPMRGAPCGFVPDSYPEEGKK